ncbi:MAG: WYL domain-containing protein [Proteobacteria bacterium]|nr:WYL domain-containing protein [Pseudomonadota bacterium]
MTYADRIEKLDTIRAYARSFCVQGFKNRQDDYQKKSPESYNNARRRMLNWLGDETFASVFDERSKGKRFHVQFDCRNCCHNPLNAVFGSKIFTNKNIFLYFTILDLLSDGVPHKCTDLISQSQACWKRYAEEWSLTPDIIRKQLNDFEAIGLLIGSRVGRDKYYSLTHATCDISAWKNALAFYSEVGTLSIVGTYLTHKYRIDPNIFIFKHHYIHHILDSEVLLAAVEAISEQKRIRAKFYRDIAGHDKLLVWTLCPLEIRVSVGTGRRWLLALAEDSKDVWRYEAIRLDDIVSITPVKTPIDREAVERNHAWLKSHLWGVTCRDLQHFVTVEMTVSTSPEEAHVLERLEREKRCGSVMSLGPYRRYFRIEVCDAEEMAPWLMSFTGYIEKLTCSDKAFERKFWEELRKLSELYT